MDFYHNGENLLTELKKEREKTTSLMESIKEIKKELCYCRGRFKCRHCMVIDKKLKNFVGIWINER